MVACSVARQLPPRVPGAGAVADGFFKCISDIPGGSATRKADALASGRSVCLGVMAAPGPTAVAESFGCTSDIPRGSYTPSIDGVAGRRPSIYDLGVAQGAAGGAVSGVPRLVEVFSNSERQWAVAAVLAEGEKWTLCFVGPDGDFRQKVAPKNCLQLAVFGTHTAGVLPPGFSAVPSTTRPGQTTYQWPSTNTKYMTREAAWQAYLQTNPFIDGGGSSSCASSRSGASYRRAESYMPPATVNSWQPEPLAVAVTRSASGPTDSYKVPAARRLSVLVADTDVACRAGAGVPLPASLLCFGAGAAAPPSEDSGSLLCSGYTSSGSSAQTYPAQWAAPFADSDAIAQKASQAVVSPAQRLSRSGTMVQTDALPQKATLRQESPSSFRERDAVAQAPQCEAALRGDAAVQRVVTKQEAPAMVRGYNAMPQAAPPKLKEARVPPLQIPGLDPGSAIAAKLAEDPDAPLEETTLPPGYRYVNVP
mmetsp:Transcript_74488/g.206890  ORF Transcript_74488/g.206890 Transcript_74488/m.206890 type:complete len:479 (-) Transcript_74488:105-1541(-)